MSLNIAAPNATDHMANHKILQERLTLPDRPTAKHSDVAIQGFVRQIKTCTSHDQVIELCAVLVSYLGPTGGRAWSHNQAVIHQSMTYAAEALRALKTPANMVPQTE